MLIRKYNGYKSLKKQQSEEGDKKKKKKNQPGRAQEFHYGLYSTLLEQNEQAFSFQQKSPQNRCQEPEINALDDSLKKCQNKRLNVKTI